MKISVVERHAHPKYERLAIQLRSNSKFYQAVTYLDGKLRQSSTKTAELRTAFKIAEDWYRRLLRASVQFGRKHPIERLTSDPVVSELYASYTRTLDATRKADAAKNWGPIQQFWRALKLSEIGPTTFRDFYTWRRRRTKGIKSHTLHKNVVLVRQVLKHAVENGLLDRLPAIPSPGSIKANPRPWLTRAEWDHLMKVSAARIDEAFHTGRLLEQRLSTQEFAQLMIVTMCRVGELLALRFRDCRFENRKGEKKAADEMLVASVTGKRGTRTIVAPPEAARIIKNRRIRIISSDPRFEKKPELADDELVFPEHHRDAFRELLKAANLDRDAHGFGRNFKSLRATAISFRLLAAGPKANLLMLARAAGTSVAMIDAFYAKRLSSELFKGDLATTVVEIAD